MENQPLSAINATGKAPPSAAAFSTPVKGVKSTRPVASATKVTEGSKFAHGDKSARPATARKLERTRAPFSPVSLNDSVISTHSASDAREAARQAKLKSEADRINKVAQLKSKWAEEKERKAAMFQERRAQEMKRMMDDNQTAAEFRKKNLEKQREIEQKEKNAMKEQLSTSLKARSQQAADLAKQNKARRRISVFLNEQMRKRAHAKAVELESKIKESEKDLLESRRMDTLAVREAKKLEDEKKRESLKGRTLRAHELRKKDEEAELRRAEEEKSLLECRHQNWEDDRSAKEEEDRSRRISLSYRLDKWRAEKAQEATSRAQQRLADELDHELESQAREDIHQYLEKQKEARRQSLSYRLDKARKDRDFELGQKALQQMVAEEERRIQQEDREDVQQYKERVLEARRQSMQYRSEHFKQEKMRQEGERQAEQQQMSKDFELRQQSWKDVQEYRRKQREEARKSLAWRLADAHRQQEVALTLHAEQLRSTHLDLLCKREDMLSQREAQEEEAVRRRRSIQLRLQSWREVRMREEKERERKEMVQEEDALFREMDREELVAAKLACELMTRRDALTSRMLH